MELPERESMDVRRRRRRRRAGGAFDRDPPEAARGRERRRGLGRGGREGLRGRRPHPLGRRDRSDRPRPARCPDWREDPERPLDDRRSRATSSSTSPPARGLRMPQVSDAAAHVEPRQLHRLARQRLPLSRAQGRGARRRDLSGLPGRRGAGRRREPRRRRRDRRPRHRPRRQAEGSASPAAWSCAGATRSSPRARAAT